MVDRYAAFVHLLPASEAHHHRGAGGLLHHGLEVAFLAGQASHGKVFAYDREPKVRRVHEPLWRLAAALAGLCHDLGKPVSDLSVTDRAGTRTWSPMQETIAAWAAGHGIDRYFLHWRDRRHNRHESAGMMALERVLGPATIAMLYRADPEIANALIDAVAGQNAGATLSQLVSDADRASVERDLKTNRIDPQATALGVPIERYLLDAMARLVRTGAWRINIPGARLWMLDEGLHVVWPQGGDEIVALLAADRVPGIPRHPDTLADLLIERGYALPPDDGDGVRRYWRLAPAMLAKDGKPVALTLLRLASPSLVLSGPAPAAVELHSDTPVRATRPGVARSEPQGHPGVGSRTVSQPFLSDGTGQDDDGDATVPPAPSHRRQAEPRSRHRQPMTRARPPSPGSGPAAPVPVPACCSPWPTPFAPGSARPRPCCISRVPRYGSVSPRASTGSALRSRPRSTPCGTTTCWRWISSSPTCACARSTASAGLSLKAEPSGHFQALVPAAALERCTQGAPMAIGPAAETSTAAPPVPDPPTPSVRRPAPTPNPPAAPPRPKATATRPSVGPKLTASAVADALLAQVRAEHARTAAGSAEVETALRLTPAAIATAAEAAGLKPQSIRRALMSRPGCTVTADTGIAVALA